MELSLLLPMLLLMLVGIIEVGRLAYFGIEVSNAARAGAQFGTQSLAAAWDTTGITTAARSDAPDIGTNLTVVPERTCGCTVSSLAACPVSGCTYNLVYLNVTTTYTLNSLFHYPGIPTTFHLTGQSTMPVRQ